jgi:hypothetical protein
MTLIEPFLSENGAVTVFSAFAERAHTTPADARMATRRVWLKPDPRLQFLLYNFF